jgi:peptidoglycan/xylan/chitin deacetylase (PgdA/CDA1 family)
MLKTISYWGSDPLAENYLLEKNHNLNFSFEKRFYYSALRPLLPIKVRQILQNKYNASVSLRENFICDELLNYLKEKPGFTDLLKNLYPENYSSAVVLTHDVEEQEGFDYIPKVIELEKKYNFKSSWNIVPYKYKIDSGIIKLIQEAGHETGIHGYNHDGKLYYSEKVFNERAKYINDAIKKYDAVGFRSPQVHRNLEWLQKLDIEYDASCFDYDPYQPFPGGTGSIWPFIAGKFVELPYTLPQDHTMFYVLRVKDINIWINKINWLVKNHGMILLITHPDYLIDKEHFKKYEELLIYLKNLNGLWQCLPREMTAWWKVKIERLND